jgi:hypothetical protein
MNPGSVVVSIHSPNALAPAARTEAHRTVRLDTEKGYFGMTDRHTPSGNRR